MRNADYDFVISSCFVYFPYFKNPKTKYNKIIHTNFHRYSSRNALFDTLAVLSTKELDIWQKYHHNVRVIPNFLPQIPTQSTNHAQRFILSVGRLSKEKGFLRLLDIWKIVQDSLSCHTESIARSISNDENKDISHSLNMTKKENLNATNCSKEIFRYAQNDKSLDLHNDDNLTQWKLIIVGDGILKKELESKIKALNLQDSIILKPFTKDIEREYLSASIYAMSSHWEGFPMVLLESASYGLAPISFDIKTGPSDIIENEKSGFLVVDNDLQGYADKLMLLMRDEKLRQNFGTEAKKLVSERFSKNAVMKEWQGLFDELCGG